MILDKFNIVGGLPGFRPERVDIKMNFEHCIENLKEKLRAYIWRLENAREFI
jgi:hypothetical protein